MEIMIEKERKGKTCRKKENERKKESDREERRK
jgi:hypothetical protein